MILLDDYLFNYTLLDDYLFNYTHHSCIIYKIITFMRFLHNQKKKKKKEIGMWIVQEPWKQQEC